MAGFTSDGQYIEDGLTNTLRDKLTVNDAVEPCSSDFCLPVNWDGPYYLNLGVIDVRDGKHKYIKSGEHFKSFLDRTNTFADEMKMGKGYAVVQKVAEENSFPTVCSLLFHLPNKGSQAHPSTSGLPFSKVILLFV